MHRTPLEGAKQKSALCPECRSKNKQPVKGFPVNYGVLSMVGTVEASSGTRSIGICNSCTKGAPKTDLYTCTTCKENSATAVDAVHSKDAQGPRLSGARRLVKEGIDGALQKVQAYREACGAKHALWLGKNLNFSKTLKCIGNLIEQRERALATIMDDLSGDALTKPQLMEKVQESEKIDAELEEGAFAAAKAALEDCHRKLRHFLALLQPDTGAPPEADASVLVVESSSDDSAPPPARRRRVQAPARRGITCRTWMMPRSDILRIAQASTSGTHQARPAATTSQVSEASVVTVENDEAAAASPSRRRRTMRQ